MAEPITLSPIGRVRSRGNGQPAEIEVDSQFVEGLDRIESQEHLWILYWMHQLSGDDRVLLKVHPRGDGMRPKRGVFALHSPCRPNPIGMTRVRLIRREENRLSVADLDALNGSPVLDIKSG